jgi:hypothetical protein
VHRSAFLKERGGVKVLVLVVSVVRADAGATGCGDAKVVGCRVPHQGSSISRGQARLPGIPSLTWEQHGAFRPRPDGLKQFVDRAAGCGGHADHEPASGRVRAWSCSVGQATDLAVAQAVVDEREDLAGDRNGCLRRFWEAPRSASCGHPRTSLNVQHNDPLADRLRACVERWRRVSGEVDGGTRKPPALAGDVKALLDLTGRTSPVESTSRQSLRSRPSLSIPPDSRR